MGDFVIQRNHKRQAGFVIIKFIISIPAKHCENIPLISVRLALQWRLRFLSLDNCYRVTTEFSFHYMLFGGIVLINFKCKLINYTKHFQTKQFKNSSSKYKNQSNWPTEIQKYINRLKIARNRPTRSILRRTIARKQSRPKDRQT